MPFPLLEQADPQITLIAFNNEVCDKSPTYAHFSSVDRGYRRHVSTSQFSNNEVISVANGALRRQFAATQASNHPITLKSAPAVKRVA
jgi:hypothetical protein